MGVCSEKRKTKESNKRTEEPTIEQRIEATKRYILRVETEISKVEYNLQLLRDEYFAVIQKCPNPVKIDDLKRDIVRNILKYQRLLNYKNALKNNLDIMENKNEENKIVNELDLNNEILENIDDGNAEKIQQNNYNLRGQNDQMNLNQQLLNEGDFLKNKNFEDILNNFLNPTKK